LKSQGLFSFQYGRLEFLAQVPEAQGLWPAAWLLGNNITTVNWPASGEQDVLERVNAALTPDWNEGSIHGTGFTGGTGLGTKYNFPSGQTAAGWHTYGMIWSKGQVQFYVDDPANVYATFTPASFPGTWPFDQGQEVRAGKVPFRTRTGLCILPVSAAVFFAPVNPYCSGIAQLNGNNARRGIGAEEQYVFFEGHPTKRN
jgi:hypothetical protein